MKVSKILRYLGYIGGIIFIILLIVHTSLPTAALIAELWISAIIEIIGMLLERHNKKK